MKERINVMIFPCGNVASMSIYNSLKDNVAYRPIAASSCKGIDSFLIADSICDLPYIGQDNFIKKLNAEIKERHIKYIIPVHDTIALFLQEHNLEINAQILCSKMETAKICRYKSLTYEALKGLDFLPVLYKNIEEVNDYPIFIKDDIGQGAHNAYLVNSKDEFKKISQSNPHVNFIMSEYLPNEEITVDCFTDRKGELLATMPRNRATIVEGKCEQGATIELTDEIKKIAIEISSRIDFRGYWFFQCKKDRNQKYKLMEISVRFAGTHGISKHKDVNFALLELYDAEGKDVEILQNKSDVIGYKTLVDFYKVNLEYDRVYFDFDDTLVFGKKYFHPLVFAFLLQCKNEGKDVVLLTRHADDIYETLKNINICSNFFNNIISVGPTQSKSDYIDNSIRSILVDNCFNDRRDAKLKKGIDTFDVSNVESLIDFYNINFG